MTELFEILIMVMLTQIYTLKYVTYRPKSQFYCMIISFKNNKTSTHLEELSPNFAPEFSDNIIAPIDKIKLAT